MQVHRPAERAVAEVKGAAGAEGFAIALGPRLGLAGALLLGEVLTLTWLVDTGDLHNPSGLARIAAEAAPALRILVMAMALSAIMAFPETRRYWKKMPPLRGMLISPAAASGNLAALAAFGFFSLRLFSPRNTGGGGDLLTVLCVASGLAMLSSAPLVFVPAEIWRRMFRAAPLAPVFGLVMTAAISALTTAGKAAWGPWMRLTYKVVLGGLHLVRGDVVANVANFMLGTSRFSVVISPECSGYEGMALMLVLSSAWLGSFRREFRFPQALLLLPAGAAAAWALNCVRILALILIGDAGAPAVAAGGFHSEAGWILLIMLAVGLLLASQRIRWLAALPPAPEAPAHPLHANETAAYLLPFLAILAAGMAAHAAAASFEWLYPLRVVAAAAVLWWFRGIYASANWRVGWESVAAGALVFAVWLGAERLLSPHGAAAGMPPELAMASDPARLIWLVFRVAGAVATVPIAEELAFRGYALRRLESADFTAVDLRTFSFLPLAVSSLLFGVLHGQRWIAGAIAGALYAAAARRRGSLGDAVAAHAVTNALLAIWVLSTGDWALW